MLTHEFVQGKALKAELLTEAELAHLENCGECEQAVSAQLSQLTTSYAIRGIEALEGVSSAVKKIVIDRVSHLRKP